MFKTDIIITLRKLKSRLPVSTLYFLGLICGYLWLLTSLLSFSIGHPNLLDFLGAVTILIAVNFNGNPYNSRKEFVVRKVLGAKKNNIYSFLLVQATAITLITSLLGLVVFDLLPTQLLLFGIKDLLVVSAIWVLPTGTFMLFAIIGLVMSIRYGSIKIANSLRIL